MAKVSDIKFQVKGVDYKVNVNCTSSGQFNANIPKEVAEALRIDEKITAETLHDLNEKFKNSLDKYKSLETVETVHIFVAYQARGAYSYRKDGSVLFENCDKKYNIEISFSTNDNAFGFDFFVAIKQTIDGKDKWFRAQLGKDHSPIQEKQYSQPDIYHKCGSISDHRLERYKIIPFNETALNTLQFAEDKLRSVSEMLFDFINQDEEMISLALTNQKLLN